MNYNINILAKKFVFQIAQKIIKHNSPKNLYQKIKLCTKNVKMSKVTFNLKPL